MLLMKNCSLERSDYLTKVTHLMNRETSMQKQTSQISVTIFVMIISNVLFENVVIYWENSRVL